MSPLDLRASPPRSCYCELDGLMLMPRTIDKLRAQLPRGNAGGYFGRLGVSETELREVVRDASDEDAVAAWLRNAPAH